MANFDIGKSSVGTISPSFIGPTLFKLSGQALPPYYKLLEKVQSEIPGLNKNVLIGVSGIISQLTPDQRSLLNDYRLVEYDLLEGEQYAKDLMF